MKINELNNLWVAEASDFKVLVVALDEEEAYDIAREYYFDADIDSDDLEVVQFTKVRTQFDCDYAITGGV